MIITQLSNWQPPAGTALEWHPTAPADASADAEPPSFLQQNHIRGLAARERAGKPHRAYLAVTTEIDGELDTAAMTRALHRFVLRHGGLRTWFDTDGTRVTRMLVPSTAVEFEARSAGETAGGDQFLDYVLERFAAEAIATSWPGFAFGAIARPDSFTVYYGCDHALSDGASQALVLSELVELYDEEACGLPAGPYSTAETGSFVDYTRIELARVQSYGSDSPEVAEWLEVFERNGAVMPSFPLDLGLARGQTAPMRGIEFDLLDRAGTTAFDAVCKQAGARYVAGIFAAVAITDLEIAGRESYYGMTVLSTRGLGNFLLSQGWFCNFAPVAFEVGSSATFTELLAHAHAGYERAIRLAAAPVQAVITALLASGADLAAVTASPNMLSYIDFRRFPGVGTPGYERGMLFTGEGETANASMWFNRDAEHLYLGCQSPGVTFAQQQLARYHARLRRVFAAVARDGDYRIGAPAGREVVLASHHD